MRLQTKVLLVALPLTAVFAALPALIGRRTTENLMVREVGRRLRPQAEDFAAGLARDWGARRESSLLAGLQSAQAFSGAEFAEALSPEGVVVAHTNVLETGKRRDDPDARAAMAADGPLFVRGRGPKGPLLTLSAPVWRPDEEFLLSGGSRTRLGTLRLGLPLAATLDSARRIGALVAAMAAAFCLAALALVLAFVRFLLLRPVQELEAAAARIAGGGYGVEVPVKSKDELGDLAAGFNRMSAALARTVVSRDRLEEALAVSRATLDASADGILVVGQDLRAIIYNRRFAEMWGLPEELLLTNDVRAMAEHVRGLLEDPVTFMNLATAPVGGDQERSDLVRLKDGRIFDRITRVFRVGGRAVGRTVTTRDMSLHFEGVREVSKARDEAQEALAILRATIEASADGILVVDKDGKLVTCNQRFLEMWGLPEDTPIAGADNLAVVERLAEQVVDGAAFRKSAVRAEEDYEAPERRDLLRLKDGRVFERLSRPYVLGGRSMGRTLTIRDLTLHLQGLRELAQARDEAEEALAISRAALDASADGILVIGKGAKVITCNDRFLEMWSLPKELAVAGADNMALVERVVPQIVNDETFSKGVVHVDADFEAPERRDLLRLKDGRVFERLSRPYLRSGDALGRTLTFRDLTLHLEGVRALALARDEALEAARVKSSFLANVSHELRTPLNSVVGSAEMLLGTRLDAEQREYADALQRATRALLGLVDGVLDFSKIEAGRMTVERTHLKPGDLLADAAALIGPRAAEKGLALKVDGGEAADEELLGDPTRLRQVLLNLLSNAVKFTSHGEVSIGAAVVARSPTWVELEFSVRDTGIGISPEQGAKLFTPFTQGDDSTTRRYGGTGLGLAISRSLVELMGGTIGFDSEPERGARFWFRLRLERGETAVSSHPPPRARPAPVRRDRLRVLVVEDNEINRRLLGRELKLLGCPSVAVGDGRAALELLGTAEFGLILLDCQMPELDGYETAREIRRLEAGKRRTPIVAFTANASESDRRRCLDAGMDDFASKPVTLDALSAVIERWDLPFDETALGVFSEIAADGPGSLARLLADFLADAEARLRAARAALDRGDPAATGRESHSIKGAAAAVGARGLKELARRLEAAAKTEEKRGEFSALLAQADAEVARLRAAASRPAG